LTELLKRGDCFPQGTEILMANGTIKEIENIEEGEKIIGKEGNPTIVLKVFEPEEKTFYKVVFNNNSKIIVSLDHHLFIKENGKEIRTEVENLKIGDVLIEPKSISFSEEEKLSYEDGYFYGLYIADGWLEKNRVRIAGKDGTRKEEQKRWVKKYAENKGYKTNWQKRFLTISSKELRNKLEKLFGKGAKNKHLPKFNYSEEGVRGLLDGLKADAAERKNELTYSSISKRLAEGIRILCKRIGLQTSIRKDVNHGGFGKNPIYRVGVRKKGHLPLKVKRIELFCSGEGYDLQTGDGGIFLSSFCSSVSNCEDSSSFVLNLFHTYELIFGVFRNWTPALAHGLLVYSNGSCSGHAFPLLLNNKTEDLSKSYVGEPTLRHYKPSESLKQKGKNYKASWGISTLPHYGCFSGGWQIKKEKRWW